MHFIAGYTNSDPHTCDTEGEAKMSVIDPMTANMERYIEQNRVEIESGLLTEGEEEMIGSIIDQFEDEIHYVTNIEVTRGWSCNILGIEYWIRVVP